MPEIIKTNYLLYSGGKVEIPDAGGEVGAQEVQEAELSESDENDSFVDAAKLAERLEPAECMKPQERTEPEVRTIIKEVYIEPPPLTREDIERMYKDEIAAICMEAEERAYRDARAAKEAEISRCIAEVDKLLQEARLELEQYMERYVKELKYFAIDVAEKMIMEKIGEDDMILEKLVIKTVSESLGSQWLKVEVSDRLAKLVEHLKAELLRPEYRGQVTVTPVEAPVDTLRVVTDTGATVASVSVQAENLRRAFSEADGEQS